MAKDDRRILNPEAWLKRDGLTLGQLGRLVAVGPSQPDPDHDVLDPLEKIYPSRLMLEDFFQSPVDKSAGTIRKPGESGVKRGFVFDASGVLRNHASAEKALRMWLGSKKGDAISAALHDWVTKGTPTEGVLFSRIEERLRKAAVTDELLYNQPICRLVRDNQLRYDPNYQAIYQLTPAQEQLLQKESGDAKAGHDRVKRNQRVYWGISETFQSLVALFDSDLGRGKDATSNDTHSRETKELIRIEVQEFTSSRPSALSPAGLNNYSPLRFWSPPPAFASSVFHMLFWRSIITGEDLFKRPVPGKNVRERAESYYVIVNYFNPAKFRIADYPNLFKAILTIARELADYKQKPGSRRKDLPLSETGRASLFYPRYFPDVQPKFQEFEKLKLSIPFATAYPNNWTLWDLAEAYEPAGASDLIECLLKFLRDRAIELILWSTYQMELRSVGLIPVQNVYLINLHKDLKEFFEEMTALHGLGGRGRAKNLREINKRVSEKMQEPNFKAKIKLKKAYGGPHRDVFCKEIIERDPENKKVPGKKKGRRPIRWLEKYNPKPVELDGVSANSDGSAKHDEEGNE